METGKKSTYRAWSQHAAVYGRWPGARLTYEVFLGEYLNRHRALAADAVEVDRGIRAAVSGMPDHAMPDAMADVPEQVEMILFRAESALRVQEARKKARDGKLI